MPVILITCLPSFTLHLPDLQHRIPSVVCMGNPENDRVACVGSCTCASLLEVDSASLESPHWPDENICNCRLHHNNRPVTHTREQMDWTWTKRDLMFWWLAGKIGRYLACFADLHLDLPDFVDVLSSTLCLPLFVPCYVRQLDRNTCCHDRTPRPRPKT